MNYMTPDSVFLTVAPKLARIRLLADLWDETRESRADKIHKLVDEIALDVGAAHLDAGLRYDPATDRFTKDAPAGNQTREDYIRRAATEHSAWVHEQVSKMPLSLQRNLLEIGCITQAEFDEAQRASNANPQLAKP